MNEDTEARERRARAHIFSGGAGSVLAIGAIPVFGWAAGIGMALLAVGNLLAARAVRATGRMDMLSRTLIIVGAVGFVVFCLLRAFRVF